MEQNRDTAKRQTWLWVDTGPGEAGWNMAYDEALLTAAERLQKPILRFYGWTEKVASFGISQSYDAIALLTPFRPLVRRPTGGGLVTHNQDWTYSLALPPRHPWYAMPAVESYCHLHHWICEAWKSLGVETRLAPQTIPDGPGQCFIGTEKFDLLWEDRKIAGAAQRRRRNGLLTQGSLQNMETSISRNDWQNAMLKTATPRFVVDWEAFKADAEFLDAVQALVQNKYSLDTYHRKR